MKNRLIAFWDVLSNSYWFIPTIMVIVAFVLSSIMIRLDASLDTSFLAENELFYLTTPDGAREVVSTVAGSMITVAGLVFSLTMVVLSLASQQYGPLILNNFMSDRVTQVVLGTFVATFIYCLLVLQTISSGDDSVFVPLLSTMTTVILAIINLSGLVYFIHHVSSSIISTNVIARAGKNILNSINTLFPKHLGEEPAEADIEQPADDLPSDFEQKAAVIRAEKSGYLQMIDNDDLLELAQEHDLLIGLKCHPGDFLVQGQALLLVAPKISEDDEDLHKRIQDAFIIGDKRTTYQDLDFAFIQMVEIAVRALSPGVNDPFTAIHCIDRLNEALTELGQRHIPSAYRYDETHTLRVVSLPFDFEALLKTAFDQIRHYGKGDTRLLLHLLGALDNIYHAVESTEARVHLLHYISQTWQLARQDKSEYEQREIDTCYESLMQVNTH